MRIVARLVAGLASLVLAYAAAAVIGGAVPANREWRPAAQGTRIYVADNGIHTDLILPAAGFRDLVRPGDIADPAMAAEPWMVFGWGDRDFYLNTASWTQLNPLRAARALVGAGPTVVHVSHVPEPRTGPRLRALTLRPEEYARLVSYVRATFAGGQPVRGYGTRDAFYPARGGYSAIVTCNEWTGRALREAGMKMGSWTPFPFGVMLWL